MTTFKKENFDFGSGSERWVTYLEGDGWESPTNPFKNKFVARFKYMSPGRSARHFVKFLIKNFTVEEYFKALDVDKLSPGEILKTKGYKTYFEEKHEKAFGYA